MSSEPTGNVGIGTDTPGEKLEVVGNIQGTRIIATTLGTAPLEVTSTVKVDNLNVDWLDGLNAADFSAAGHDHAIDGLSDVSVPTPADGQVLTYNQANTRWEAQAVAEGGDSDWLVAGNDMSSEPTGNVGIGTDTPGTKLDVEGNVRGQQLIATTAGAAPFEVSSTVLVDNLNADQLDGLEAADFAADDHDHPLDGLSDVDVTGAQADDIIAFDGASWIAASQTAAVSPPIGAVVAFLKELTGTPALPDGWVECNGQTLSDGDSPYDGQTIPDLNGVNRFLRGNGASGNVGGDESHSHTYSIPVSGGGPVDTIMGGDAATNYYDHSGLSTETAEQLPPYYNVVWVMRVK